VLWRDEVDASIVYDSQMSVLENPGTDDPEVFGIRANATSPGGGAEIR
jgi:hypothetical protein